MGKSRLTLLVLVLGVVFAGCAGLGQKAPFEPVDLTPKVHSGFYVEKVDHFAVVLDASQSMNVAYNDVEKFKRAKEIVSRLNHTIPELTLEGALVAFGGVISPFGTRVAPVYGLEAYSKSDFADALKKVDWAGGHSPLAEAMGVTQQRLDSAQGRLAVIIVSDGHEMDDSPVYAARTMKEAFGDRVCMYTILVGDDPAGRGLLEEIARVGECGFAVSADDIAAPEAMADFVERIFLASDKDADGVPDDMDQCPDTPRGAKVDEKGCWELGAVLFDTNKTDIKPMAYPFLDEIADVLKNNPGLRMEIQGHTDTVGTKAYNDRLSKRRAEAVLKYFTQKGVEAKQLSVAGYGFRKPVASNDTAEGRAQNRRVEFRVLNGAQ